MTTALDPMIQAVNAATLAPLVQRVLNQDIAQVTQWTAEVLKSNRGGGLSGGMIYRFSGSVQAQGADLPWSLILKVLPEPARDGPAIRVSNWRREVEFYRSDLSKQLSGLRATFCYAIEEHTDATGRMVYWLWLEELKGEANTSWSLEDYHQVAYHLGQFNGAFLVDRPLPALSWLRRNATREYIEAAEPWVVQLQEQRNHPLVTLAFPAPEIESYLHLWQQRALYLAILDTVPQTLCHLDAQRSNLFLQTNAVGKSELVAIDWATVGVGSIGLDINQMFAFALLTGGIDVAQAAVFDQAIYTGYPDGLRDAGWQGDPALVRLGYTTAAVRSRTMGVYRYLEFALDEARQRLVERIWRANGMSLDEGIKRRHQVELFFCDLIREADQLRANLM